MARRNGEYERDSNSSFCSVNLDSSKYADVEVCKEHNIMANTFMINHVTQQPSKGKLK